MKDTENNKDTKKFSLKKLDYTENMVELMTVVNVLGAQIEQIEKNQDAKVHKNLLQIISNIKQGLQQETTYDKEKAKKIIEKRGVKIIKFDKKQDKTGLLRKFANSAIYELTDFENLLGKNMKDSKGVENNSNILTNAANKVTLGVVPKNLTVSEEINNHIQNIATISADFAEAANSKERAFYLQQMNDELNKLVKSKDNDMKWDKSFKAYLTEFVESFQKFLTITAPSLFKKQIAEDKKYNIIFEARQQLEVQQKEIFDSLTRSPGELAAIQLTYSNRTPNNIGSPKDFEEDLLNYKQGVKNEEKTEANKNFLQKGFDKVKNALVIPEKSSVFTEQDLKSAQAKMNEYFELMRQKKQLANYASIDPTQQQLNAAHAHNKQFQKEQSMLLHLLEEAQQPLKDRTQLPGELAINAPKSSEEVKNLIANLCKKIPPVEDAVVISGHKKQTGLSNQVKPQQQATVGQRATPANIKTTGESKKKTNTTGEPKTYITLEQLQARNNAETKNTAQKPQGGKHVQQVATGRKPTTSKGGIGY